MRAVQSQRSFLALLLTSGRRAQRGGGTDAQLRVLRDSVVKIFVGTR